MSFRILGLSPEPFRPLFDLSDAELVARGARRVFAEGARSAPCRVSLAHAAPGEELLLVNHEHQSAHTPYRASHAIYVRRAAGQAFEGIDVVPEPLAVRTLSVRAFDAGHMIVNADLCDGPDAAAALFEHLLADPATAYLHAHYARYGCFAARIERA